MKRLLITAAAASSLALGGCATNPAYDHQIAGTATGAVIGAGAGALAGSVLPGIGTGAGAAVGAVLGGAVGAIVNGHNTTAILAAIVTTSTNMVSRITTIT